ncbi:MAG: PQQ-dependent sugar dehydrogenase [Nocardioides sp.]|nr:PQQ-dependent sugar dehydrogenase [Nocardioides sp.]
MLRRAAATLVALATCLTAAVAVPGEPAAAAPRPIPTVAPAPPILGERVTVRVRLPRGVRPVRLQQRAPTGWATVARSRTKRTGVATFDYRVRQPRPRLRVVAPAHRVGERRHPRAVSRVRRVNATAPQTVSFTASRAAAGGVDVRAVLSHVRRGRAVHVQQRTADRSWHTLRTVRAGRSRVVPVAGVPVARGASLRVRLGPHQGAPATGSAVLHPPTVAVQAVTDGAQVHAAATTTGAVQRVRFFADGVLVAEETSPPWRATWSSRIGVHDVVARAVGPVESVLSDAATYETGAAPVGMDSGVAEGFALETVQSGLFLPTSAGSLPSGAVLVTEKSGLVKVVEPAEETGWSPPRKVLDLRDEVHDGGDAGLIGIAIDPDVASNGFVYLSYVRDDAIGQERSQQVARFTWDGEVLDPGSRHVVLGSVSGPACSSAGDIRTDDCVPLLGEAHTIGDLVFDDEGRLLVGIGDGAIYLTNDGLLGRHEAWRAQDPDVLAGKVLRIDATTGRGVPGNPLYTGDGSSNASRVLALGLRNPFRFTVHEGRLVIGDVGEGDAEEIDVHLLDEPHTGVPNFGWPCLEGKQETSLGDVTDPSSPWHGCADVRLPGVAIPPAHAYPHATGGGSVSGGVFLTSEAYPQPWRGRYVFGDYAQNFIRTAEMTADGRVSGLALLADASAAGGPVKFFTGPDGLVWSVSIMGGALQRIRWTGEALAETCPVGTFRRTFHDLDGPDSVFDREFADNEWKWLFPYAAAQLPSEVMGEATCESRIHLDTTGSPWVGDGVDDRDHPGDRFGAAWRGRLDLEEGTYRFVVQGDEWVRLWVDDKVVHDFYANAFWPAETRQHDVTLGRGQHVVRAEMVHGDAERAFADITWSRVGGAASIRLEAPANGVVASDGTVDWRVVVSDPDGDTQQALTEDVELAVDFLHYAGSSYHSHPSSRISGRLSGTLAVDDVHAPGRGIVRLRATVTDASGARSTSAPVYVCFPGGDVGPCAD